MNKVITINLNGNAFQIDEGGHAKLHAYLESAGQHLSQDPDKTEILADIEQSLADKCHRFINSHKNVINESEIDQIISEMGPVSSADASGKQDENKEEPSKDASSPKRLFRIRDGSVISGVCTGLAAYFNVDVTFIRIAFVVLALISHGVGIVAYIIMIAAVPAAKTPKEYSAASGTPFNAQELIDRVKREYSTWDKKKFKEEKREWKHRWREEARLHRQAWEEHRHNRHDRHHGTALSAAVHTILVIVFILALLSLVTTHAVFGLAFPASIPFWLSIVLLVIAYGIAASMALYIFWLLVIGLFLYFAYHNVPQVHTVLDQIIATARHAFGAMKK